MEYDSELFAALMPLYILACIGLLYMLSDMHD